MLLIELSVPANILARGETAVKAFEYEMQNGEITVVNARFMFMGKEGAGKTSCVNSILGKAFNEVEPSTDGIATTTVFQIVGKDCRRWKEQPGVDVSEITKQVRDHAIAEHVVKMLKQPTSQKQTSASNTSSLMKEEEATSLKTLKKRESPHEAQYARGSSTIQSTRNPANIHEKRQPDKVVQKPANEIPGPSNVGASNVTSKWNFFRKMKYSIAHRKTNATRLTLNDIGPPLLSHGAGGLSTSQSTSSHANTLEQNLPGEIYEKVIFKLANQKPGPSNVGPSDVTSIWDYAGQLKYYISHRLYLTDRSAYGVVFSLLDKLDEFAKPRNLHQGNFEMTNLQMTVFWIRSIYEHAVLLHNVKETDLINREIHLPPISLIATHKDQLTGSDAENEEEIKSMFKDIFEEIKGTAYEKHVDRTIYAVDNTAEMDEGIEKLKKNVGGYMKAMAKTIPTNWVDFQSKVQVVGKTRLSLPLDEITKIAFKCGISKISLTTVLDYLNDTGIILYSKTNEKLKNTVITNLRMMIDLLTKIITVVPPDDIDKVPALMDLWHKLDEMGILEEKLLRHLWRHEIAKDASNFEVFLELMKMFGLLFEKQMGAQCNRTFIVPSRMQVTRESLKVKGDEKQTVSIYVTPTDFLPDAVYHMLVVKFLDLMSIKGRSCDYEKLFGNCSDFDFDDDHVVSLGAVNIKNRHALKLEISHMIEQDANGQNLTFEPHPSICMEVLNYLRDQLKNGYVTTEGIGYKLRVLCNKCQPTNQPHLHDLEDCLKKRTVPCGKMAMNTSRFKRLFSIDLKAEFIEETRNFQTIQSLIIDFGTRKMKEFFLRTAQQTSSSVVDFLKKEKEKGRFEKLKHFQGHDKMFSPDADIDTFDIEILMTLIRYCCGFTFSDDMWQQPHKIRNPELANLIRIHQYKNTKLDQNTSCRIPTKDFEEEWKGIKKIFLNLGVTSKEIEDIRHRKGFDKTTLEEMQNFQAIMSLVVDLGTDAMRKYFLRVNKLKEKDVGQFLMNKESNLREARLFKEQKKKMFTIHADIKSFDISIMIKIIRYCCNPFPESFWSDPDEKHGNILTNLVRIHQYRNKKLAHSASARMPTDEFEVEWKKLKSILEGAGVPLEEIDKYKQLRLIV